MRVVVIAVPARRSPIPPYVTALAKGMEAMGHRADVLDAWTGDGSRLPAYEYIAVCAEAVSLFGGKMPEALHRILASGNLTGKKSAAFLKKTGPFTTKAMSSLMRGMEKEGMYINWSDIILSAEHAEALGKRIG
ncbi:hypothetical protein AGMMS49944_14240 [Spirochaetia bacterium]|nr:hypothetical protein AGMMS49944_14240 [Spirochaetia bacterium]